MLQIKWEWIFEYNRDICIEETSWVTNFFKLNGTGFLSTKSYEYIEEKYKEINSCKINRNGFSIRIEL